MSQNNTEKQNNAASALRGLSAQDFYNFGVHHVAYIRLVTVEDRKIYSVHTATGQKIHALPTMQEAIDAVRDHDLEPVRVH